MMKSQRKRSTLKIVPISHKGGGGVCTFIGKENTVTNFALAVWACFYSYQPNYFCKLSYMIGPTCKTLKIEFWDFPSRG